MQLKLSQRLVAAAIAALSVGAVCAQSTAPAMESSPAPAAKSAAAAPMEKPMTAKEIAAVFTKADANKDGKLDMAEAQAIPALAARFEQVDTDGDKLISKAEFEKAMKQ